MGFPLKQSSTDQPLPFFLTASSDHITGLTGKAGSVVVKIRKPGGAGVTPSGAITEIDATNMPGWYQIAANATDNNTLGPLLLHAKDAASDPYDDLFPVVAYDPLTVSLGLSLAKTTNLTGLNDIAATSIVSSGPITTNGGAVSTVSTVIDKAGYSLSVTGLDAISVADPGTPAQMTTFPKRMMAIWRWLYSPKAVTPTSITTLKDDGTTTNSTQSVNDDHQGNITLGAGS